MSEDERDREIASMGQAHEQAFAEAEARTRAWFEARGDAWEPDEFYRGVPATEEDLERADQFEGEARWQHYLAQIGGEGEGGVEEPGIAGEIRSMWKQALDQGESALSLQQAQERLGQLPQE